MAMELIQDRPKLLFSDEIVEWNGLPGTLELAKTKLALLFKSKQWVLDDAWVSMHWALSILEAYPELAAEEFHFPFTSVYRRELACGVADKSFLPPICHFFRTRDVKAIQSVYDLYPDVIRGPHGYLDLGPLHVAFHHHHEEHKKLVASSLKKHPAEFEDGFNFLSYLNCVMIPQMRSHIDSTCIKAIGDLLWSDGLVALDHFPEHFGGVLSEAVCLECQPVINYLMSKVPECVWSRSFDLKFEYIKLDMCLARGLEILLPTLRNQSILFRESSDNGPDNDAFVHLAKILAQECNASRNRMHLEVSLPDENDRDASTRRALESLFSETSPLYKLSLCNVDDVHSMRALVDGLEQNNTIEHLLLSSWGRNVDSERNGEALYGLLKNAPRTLEMKFSDIKTIPMCYELAFLKSSRLQTLKVQDCDFEANSFERLIECISKLPLLQTLCLELDSRALSGSGDVTGALLALLKLDHLQKLVVSGYILDVDRLCPQLEHSKNLLDLQLDLELEEEFQAVANLLKKKKTLVCQCYRRPWYDPLTPSMMSQGYYSLLNKAGRWKANDPEMKLKDFIDLIDAVITFKKPRYAQWRWTYNLSDPSNKTSIVYGLLMEQPSLWIQGATEEARQIISDNKR